MREFDLLFLFAGDCENFAKFFEKIHAYPNLENFRSKTMEIQGNLAGLPQVEDNLIIGTASGTESRSFAPSEPHTPALVFIFGRSGAGHDLENAAYKCRQNRADGNAHHDDRSSSHWDNLLLLIWVTICR